MKNNCPRCEAEITNNLLFQCVRCFSKYCRDCEGSDDGRICPQCGVHQRILVPADGTTGKYKDLGIPIGKA